MTTKDPRPIGFTLVEILVVLAIIGILAAIVTPLGMRALQRARQSEAMVVMKEISDRVGVAALTRNGYPKDPPESMQIKDPWGNLYTYSSDGDSFELRCLGRDGLLSEGITVERRDEFDLDIVVVDGRFVNRPFD